MDADVTIGPLEHASTFCRIAASDGIGCRCWCLACEQHNAVDHATLTREGAAPAVTETADHIIRLPDDATPVYVDGFRHGWSAAIDAFLASPQAAEELARALALASFPSDALSRFVSRKDRREAAAVLAAWQKVREQEEAG